MVDRWIERYRPEDVVAALAPHLGRRRRVHLDAALAARLCGLTVVLEDLHDPHNGAAALRSVEGLGLSSLHVVERAKRFRFSSRVTQGCEKWLAIRRFPDFGACARDLGRRGFVLWAAVPGAARTLDQVDVSRPAALAFGNEHAGLSAEARAACDAEFDIPLYGFTRSFNLSVSVAVSVFECARRRRLTVGGASDLSWEEQARMRARWYALSMDERMAAALVARHVSTVTRCDVGEEPHGR